MTGILRIENLNRGNTLKQGDLSTLKYRLYDADSDNLAISGKSAKVRLMKKGFTFIAYEKEGLVVSSDNTISFNINKVLPGGTYYLEVLVDNQYVFPSRGAEGQFNIDRSSLGAELNIIENLGVDAVAEVVVEKLVDDNRFVGPKGDPGKGLVFLGTATSVAKLPAPTNANIGNAYVIGEDLYVSNGTQWINTGNLKGPKGDKGDKGERGLKGDKGDQGIQGVKGDKGDTGSIDGIDSSYIEDVLGFMPISADDVQEGLVLGEGPIEKGWLFKPVIIADERNE